MSRARCLAALLACALLAGGCATGETRKANDYVNAVNSAQTTFAHRSERLLAGVEKDVPDKGTRQVVRRFYAAVDDLEADLRRIDPPGGVRRLHRRLVAAADLLGRRLRVAGADITSSNAGRILQGQELVTRAVSVFNRELDSATAAINDALGR